MAWILHLDTSTDYCSVAISNSGNLVHTSYGAVARDHAAAINTLINETLDACGITFARLQAVAVCSGPGSYTGLRIAMSTAKGICYALSIPLIANDRLSLIAGNAPDTIAQGHHIAVILKAREKEYFAASFHNNKTLLHPPTHMLEEDLIHFLNQTENLHIISDLPYELFTQLKVNFLTHSTTTSIPHSYWAHTAFIHYESNSFVNSFSASPMYLKQVFTHN